MRKKMAMVGWFDPAQLVQTGIRVAISTVFGEFADKREAFAAANPIDDSALDPRFDYAARHAEGEFWIDYVADTGDGWNPTYAIARLLAANSIRPQGTSEDLPRARVLVMGGDEVYPTASREDYENRLLYPFDEAYRPEGGAPRWTAEQRPDLFAVPGNHDWYDGLRTFFHLFCRRSVKEIGEAEVDREGRVIGGRQTHQTRSYFALKLPGGWWLWGTDSQLEGEIDQPQVDYFQYVSESWMEPGSKLILCTGTPDWQYVDPESTQSFRTFSYLERLAPAVRGKGHELKLVLSGDSHHYVRFQELGRNYITCGGGGAFLHPTHTFTDRIFDFDYPPAGVDYVPADAPYRREFRIAKKADGTDALYPSRAVSRALPVGNVAFALRNWKFALALWPAYLLFTWLLDFNAWVFHDRSLASLLAPGSLTDAMDAYWRLVLSSPWPALLCGLGLAGYYYFADFKKPLKRFFIGALHALVQALVVTAVTCLVVRGLAPWWAGFWGIAGCLLLASLVSAFVSATVVGFYLWICLSVFGAHSGHLSSLAIQDYKCFLRLKIDRAGALTVYPIGLTKVPGDSGAKTANPPLKPELIEDPIVIA